MSDERAILLTGASGVVGRAVLRELTGHRVICLTHSGTVPVEGVEVLRSDLTEPRLGLDRDSYENLARDVDVIIHSAALTEWGRPAESYGPINVGGTRQIIELAGKAGAPVHYMSTSFVAALSDEAPVKLRPDNVVRNYVRSKRESELLLAESGVPHSVWRPTNLIGDSRTGETLRPQIVQLVSDWICRGRAALFPAHPGNLIDIVPQDLLARAVVRAIELDDVGGDFWVTYGAEAMTVADALRILMEHTERQGRTPRPPRIVHPDELDPVELERMPAMSRAYVDVLVDVSEITACSGGALPSSMGELRERYGIPHVRDTDAYQRSLDYWAAESA